MTRISLAFLPFQSVAEWSGESSPAISHLRCAHKHSWRLASCLNSLSAHNEPVSGPYRKHPRQGWGAEVLWAVVPKDFSHPPALPWRVPSSHRLPGVHLAGSFFSLQWASHSCRSSGWVSAVCSLAKRSLNASFSSCPGDLPPSRTQGSQLQPSCS